MYKNNFTVDLSSEGLRLDKFLEKKLDINRSQIKKNIDLGNILLNKNIVKAGYQAPIRRDLWKIFISLK